MIRLFAMISVLITLEVPAAVAGPLAQVMERGSLRACVSLIDPRLISKSPKDCAEGCDYTGLIIEQVDAFAQSLGDVSVDLRDIGWSQQFANANGVVDLAGTYSPQSLSDGSCDLYVSNLTVLEWRTRKMDIVPLFQSRMIVMVKAERVLEFEGLASLAGRTAAILPDSSFQKWIVDRNIDTFADNPVRMTVVPLGQTFDRVADGSVDFAFADADIAVLAMANRPGDIAPAFAVGPEQSLGWGVSRDAPALRARVEQFFAASRANPNSSVNLAWHKWLGVTLPEFEALVRALPAADSAKAVP